MPISASDPAAAPPVWRGYTREGLEAQYRLTYHPDRAPSYERFAERSRTVRANSVWEPIAYGAHPRERIELFHGDRGAPLLVFVHGGYWRALEMETFSFVAEPFVERGVWVANVEYPLAPEVSVTVLTRCVMIAIGEALRAAARGGADPGRVVVSGHSAGGHLAGVALAVERHLVGSGPFALAGAVPISGLFELEPLRLVALNDTLGMDAEEAARLSPMRVVRGDLPPVVAAVGADETDEFRRQSIDYAAAIRAAGGRAEALLVPGKNHFTVLDALADPAAPLFRETLALLDGSPA